jgi:hypothetical protein
LFHVNYFTFQLAGYRHVIGTPWPINDQKAVDFADDIDAALASVGNASTAAVRGTKLQDWFARRRGAGYRTVGK